MVWRRDSNLDKVCCASSLLVEVEVVEEVRTEEGRITDCRHEREERGSEEMEWLQRRRSKDFAREIAARAWEGVIWGSESVGFEFDGLLFCFLEGVAVVVVEDAVVVVVSLEVDVDGVGEERA